MSTIFPSLRIYRSARRTDKWITTITNQIDTVSVKPNSTVCLWYTQIPLWVQYNNQSTKQPPAHLACQIKLFATRRRHVIIWQRVCIYVSIPQRLSSSFPISTFISQENECASNRHKFILTLSEWVNHRNKDNMQGIRTRGCWQRKGKRGTYFSNQDLSGWTTFSVVRNSANSLTAIDWKLEEEDKQEVTACLPASCLQFQSIEEVLWHPSYTSLSTRVVVPPLAVFKSGSRSSALSLNSGDTGTHSYPHTATPFDCSCFVAYWISVACQPESIRYSISPLS